MPKLLALTPGFTVRVTQAVPSLEPGEVHRATQTTRLVDGPAVTVAQAAQNLGHHAEIGGFIGKVNARFVRRNLDRQGWTGHYVECDGETNSTLIIGEADGRSTVISEQQMTVGPEQVAELVKIVASLQGQFDWGSLSGTLMPGTSGDSFAAICKAVRPAKLALHINVSNDLAFSELAHQHADLLCLDRIGAELKVGREISSLADARSACVELQGQGNRIVVINVDEQSTVSADGDQCWLVTKNPEAVIDRDRMFGVLLAVLMDGQPLRSALGQGMAAGCAPSETGETFEALLPYTSIQVLP